MPLISMRSPRLADNPPATYVPAAIQPPRTPDPQKREEGGHDQTGEVQRDPRRSRTYHRPYDVRGEKEDRRRERHGTHEGIGTGYPGTDDDIDAGHQGRRPDDDEGRRDEHGRAQEFPEPDRPRRHRPREVERQPVITQLAADHRRAEDGHQAEGETHSQPAGGGRDHFGEGEMNAREERDQQRQYREGEGGGENKAFFCQFTAGDDHRAFHGFGPSPGPRSESSSQDTDPP